MGIFSFFRKPDEGIFRELKLKDGKRLFVSPMPFGAYDPHNLVLKNYLQAGVQHVVMLVREDELHNKARKDIRNLYLKNKLTYAQFELMDFTAPTLDALDKVIIHIVEQLNQGQRVAIHCHAGTGRTAIGACCVATAINGLTVDDAMKFVNESMEVHLVDEQVRLMKRWEKESTLLTAGD